MDNYIMAVMNDSVRVDFVDNNAKIEYIVYKRNKGTLIEFDRQETYVSVDVNDTYMKKIALIILLQYSCGIEFNVGLDSIRKRMSQIINSKFRNVFRELNIVNV